MYFTIENSPNLDGRENKLRYEIEFELTGKKMKEQN